VIAPNGYQAHAANVTGTWTWNPVTDEVTWSGSIAPMYELTTAPVTYAEHIDATHPGDRAGVDAAWRRVVTSGQTERQVYRSRSGILLSAQARLVRVDGAPFVLGTIRQLNRPHPDEKRFADLFRQIPVGAALLSTAGVFVEVNDGFCAMLGYRRVDLLGTEYHRLVHPDEVVESTEARTRALDERTADLMTERRLVRADGSEVWVRAVTRRFEDGDLPFFLTVFEDITSRRAAESRLTDLALHDSLTGLPNRRLMLDRLELALARSRRDGRDVAVLFLDLDHVKRVNDALGHEAGDDLLIAVSKHLVAAIRETDTVSRLGGDEFVIVCENIESVAELEELAARVLAAVQVPVDLGGEPIVVTASIGVITPSSVTDRPQDLLRAADAAMYRAKQAGRARFTLEVSAADPGGEDQMSLEAELRRAIDADELVLHYQPIVAQDGLLVSMEALVRWRHPTRGLLVPEDFLFLLSQPALGAALTEWVMEQALSDAAAWPAQVSVSVNVGVDQLRAPGFAAAVTAQLLEAGLSGERLRIEVLEDQLADTTEISVEVEPLVAAGVTFAVDDFGTGYSSLAYLKRLPIRVVKIDRSFIRTICDDAADASIVKAVLDACRATGRISVAEGVETVAQLTLLRSLGCDLIQGSLVTMPAPLELLSTMLAAGRATLP